jgi:hypothetical protein
VLPPARRRVTLQRPRATRACSEMTPFQPPSISTAYGEADTIRHFFGIQRTLKLCQASDLVKGREPLGSSEYLR